jgi:hypothetical protein
MTGNGLVPKPDFATRPRGFMSTDEHEALRESIRTFVEREITDRPGRCPAAASPPRTRARRSA